MRSLSTRIADDNKPSGKDRLPTRRELLDQVAFLAQLVDELAEDRARLATALADLVCTREGVA